MTTIISDDEREKQVLDLYYNQRKNTRDIAKILRISFTKIGNILKKEREREQREREKEKGKEIERQKNHSYNNDDDGNGNGKAEQQQQHHHQIIPTSSSSAISSLSQAELENLSPKQKAVLAYKLYDQGKSPVQVSIALCLTAKEAMAYQREFWRLKGHHQLYQIYPEIEQSLPSFLKLFKGLKKHGLNPQNVEWYVDAMNIGMKLEDLEPDYENLQSKNQSLRSENQDIVNGIQYNRRIFENESKAMKKHIAGLSRVAEQQQQNVDTLSERILGLANQKQSLEEFVYRFRSTNQKYLRIKGTAREVVNRFWSQALREPDKKMLMSIVLSSVVEALRENPDRYNIIFGGNTNDNNDNNNIYAQQNAVLEVSAKLSKALIERLVNETMNALESQSESDMDIAAEENETEGTESTETKSEVTAEAGTKDTESAAAEEEEETNSKDKAQ